MQSGGARLPMRERNKKDFRGDPGGSFILSY